ncbi:MAG TPA: hypothetical protein VGS22_14645 [Thermoanaerobaculia bacterium]|nr:hypothetical protein [Thermoanaerobaculia bacterium]
MVEGANFQGSWKPPPGTSKNKSRERNISYDSSSAIYNPYLGCKVALNADGFNHLQSRRPKQEQVLRFRLLPLALETIRRSATLQEYRRILRPVGKTSVRGETRLAQVEYWGFVAIMDWREAPVKVRTVLRRVGGEEIVFWSVMPYGKLRKGEQRLSTEGIEDD